ncbi:MAG: hypothetical protein EBE86_029980 [Hormoscilla sp. GUM202]|nr:hypothetical protein [Hormoscilla sp. GUM202]
MERQLSWNVTCTDSAIAKESNNWTWLWDNFYGCGDLFERAIAMKYMYTAEETAQLRAKLIEDWVKPFAAACFEKSSQLQSIMLLVVQPENEFICDAVYDKYIFSILKNPDLSAARASEYKLSKDLVNLPGFY